MTYAKSLSTAQLAIYAILAPPTIYNLVRHGRSGLLGWLYLFIFGVLRITGSAMSLSNPSSTGGIVIINIGLSPLLLATLGILHEARTFVNPFLARRLEIPLQTALHLLIAAAIGLIAAGASALTGSSPTSSDVLLVKIGMVTLLVSWLIILIVAVVSLLPSQVPDRHGVPSSHKFKDGSKLLYAVLASLPLTGLRVLYGVVSVFVNSAVVNPVNSSLALRVCLQVLPEMLSAILFTSIGIWTRNLGRK